MSSRALSSEIGYALDGIACPGCSAERIARLCHWLDLLLREEVDQEADQVQARKVGGDEYTRSLACERKDAKIPLSLKRDLHLLYRTVPCVC
jgi:hypothetical protein